MEFAPAPAGSILQIAWLIPVVPAVSAGIILLFGRRIGRPSAALAIIAVGVSAVLSTLVFAYLQGQPEEARSYLVDVAAWLNAGALEVRWTLLLDPLASMMLLLVTWVGLLIHVYSLGYMADDERYTRFFAYLNLFAASMLLLVTGGSFLTLFVGWELVGLSSYLLVGFWFENRPYASAAKKAFVVNRVGDVGFMIAMFLIFAVFGSLSFADVLPAAGALSTGTAAAIALLLFAGATAKSAQIPLYVWLPDAMAGPTPVSALIHAATMVTAGVYLLARSSPILTLVGDVGLFIAWIGVLTALLAAAVACAQNDLKKILAYSTVSQLGYMFVAVGVGHYVAAIFHLLTHGFFKALLFLAAGSVMHALHDETDVRRMGGLFTEMRITASTSLLAVGAIAGLWPLSGYFSKEEILAAAADTSGGGAIWAIGVVVAGLTAFYMTRWFVLIFAGPRRWAAITPDPPHPHESPPSMTVPLVVLAAGAAFGGFLNIDPEDGFLHHWLEPSVVAFEPTAEFLPHGVLIAAALGVAVLGIALAIAKYRQPDVERIGTAGGLVQAARERFYVDELYERVVAGPGALLARGFAIFDKEGIDRTVDGVAHLTGALSRVGRQVQTGFVRSYALATLLGAVVVAGLFLVGAAR